MPLSACREDVYSELFVRKQTQGSEQTSFPHPNDAMLCSLANKTTYQTNVTIITLLVINSLTRATNCSSKRMVNRRSQPKIPYQSIQCKKMTQLQISEDILQPKASACYNISVLTQNPVLITHF